MAKIFISYCSDDKTSIGEVVGDLESLGHAIWFDNELVGGQSWWDRILKEIENCDYYLCALSSAYLKSNACSRELAYASALGKTIIPIKVVDDFDERFLTPGLGKLQITDLESGSKKGVLSLINALNSATVSPAVPDPLPAPPTIPVSYLSELLLDINSKASLDQDQQASLVFKLRDHFRTSGDISGVLQALDKFESRKDLLANIGREVDALRKEINLTVINQRDSIDDAPDEPEPVPVFRKFQSIDDLKDDLKEVVETSKLDLAAMGFGVLSFLVPFIGVVLFFVWRKEKPRRAKVVSWAAAIGLIVYFAAFDQSTY